MIPGNKMEFKLYDKYGFGYKKDSGDMMVKIDCNDCLQRISYDPNILSNEKSKIASLLKEQEGNCNLSLIANKRLFELYDILKEMRAGFISINPYENGTRVEFMVREPEGFDMDNNLEVCTPGVHKEVLEVGKEYYICFTKDAKQKKIFETKKLKKIELTYNNSYNLIFEGLDRPIKTLTRGHKEERQKLLNRIDNKVISANKDTFIAKTIQQIGKECEENPGEYDKLLKKFIKEKSSKN